MKIQNNVSVFGHSEIGQNMLTGEKLQKIDEKAQESLINVTISKEGQKKFRESIAIDQTIEKNNNETFEKSLKEVKFVTDFGIVLSGKINEVMNEKNQNLTVKDEAECILEGYSRLYDEIVQGYEDGSRESYTIDKDSETGYRKLTKEEELKGLDDTYKAIVSGYETRVSVARKVNEILKREYQKIVDAKGMRKDTVQKYLGEIEKIDYSLAEKIPENISEKLILAANSFRTQYNGIESGKALVGILSGINVW